MQMRITFYYTVNEALDIRSSNADAVSINVIASESKSMVQDGAQAENSSWCIL